MKEGQILWCTHHQCNVTILDPEPTPSESINCKFNDGRTQYIPKIYLIDVDIKQIRKSFGSLMGMNGDKFVTEIYTTGKLKQSSYDIICDNISYNSKDSIIEHFGLVHYYYLQNKD